jgi:hypothetical protein
MQWESVVIQVKKKLLKLIIQSNFPLFFLISRNHADMDMFLTLSELDLS